MRIDRIWSELEAEPLSQAGWIARLARPHVSHCPLHVALDQASRARALLLPTGALRLPQRALWPECAGLELAAVTIGGHAHLSIKLRDAAAADVFTVLAEDLAERLASARDDQAAISTLFNQLGRWQLFLTASRDGLGMERQRGLYGELLLASNLLAPRIGMAAAIDAWKGSSSAHQDFQLTRGAIEVKASAAKEATAVRISSERQLDDTGVGALFLHVFLLDEREVPAAPDAPGESLGTLIERIRRVLSGDVSARSKFEDKLLLAGWLEPHAARYEGRRWAIRSQTTFRVAAGFPRVVEADLRRGIGDVSYALDLAVCEPFHVSFDELLTVLL